MTRRQTVPKQWLIVTGAPDPALRRLPHGTGVLLLQPPTSNKAVRLSQLARLRGLTLMREGPRTASRVHNMRELTRALHRRTPMILLSPIYRTNSHPDWPPLPRMRAATLARLTGRRAIALGGMNHRRYAAIATLGFIGWAGISAFRT